MWEIVGKNLGVMSAEARILQFSLLIPGFKLTKKLNTVRAK